MRWKRTPRRERKRILHTSIWNSTFCAGCVTVIRKVSFMTTESSLCLSTTRETVSTIVWADLFDVSDTLNAKRVVRGSFALFLSGVPEDDDGDDGCRRLSLSMCAEPEQGYVSPGRADMKPEPDRRGTGCVRLPWGDVGVYGASRSTAGLLQNDDPSGSRGIHDGRLFLCEDVFLSFFGVPSGLSFVSSFLHAAADAHGVVVFPRSASVSPVSMKRGGAGDVSASHSSPSSHSSGVALAGPGVVSGVWKPVRVFGVSGRCAVPGRFGSWCRLGPSRGTGVVLLEQVLVVPEEHVCDGIVSGAPVNPWRRAGV